MERRRAVVLVEVLEIRARISDAGREDDSCATKRAAVVDIDGEALPVLARSRDPAAPDLDRLVRRQLLPGGREQLHRVLRVTADVAVRKVDGCRAVVARVDDDGVPAVAPQPRRRSEAGNPSADDNDVMDELRVRGHDASTASSFRVL